MSEEHVTDRVEEGDELAGREQGIGLREFGRVTERTKGSWLGLFLDGGIPPFSRELLPLSIQND